MQDWNDLFYRTLALAYLDWPGFHRVATQHHGVFVRIAYNEGVYCRDEADFEALSKEFPFVLHKPCDCKKSQIELPPWDAFLEHGLDSQQFIKWCEDKKAAKFDWGNDKGEGFNLDNNPDVLWYFDVDGARRFHIRRVQPFHYVDAAVYTLEEHDERFRDLARKYREACHQRAGLPAKKKKWAEEKVAGVAP